MTIPDGDLDGKRVALAQVRRATQTKLLALASAGLFARLLFKDQPWLLVGSAAPLLFLGVRWILEYRRLKAALGLQQEYDELDENAAWGGKTAVVLLSVFGGISILMFLIVWLMRKH